jgi:pimeloyl-ACP methyl ester carboxylesterase
VVTYGYHMPHSYQLDDVDANGISIRVATVGDGPPVLLLHGWPHTWMVWHRVIPLLVARGHRVIAPDLRGLGATSRPVEGYDLHTLADDAAALLDALDAPRAGVVGIDLGAPVAWMLAARQPDRVRRLVVMEALLGRLPGAERFLAAGPPWWFGFHAVPDLAETVIEGHEAEYLEWFFRSGTAQGRGIDDEARDAFVAAYRGRNALRSGFAHYRAMAANATLIAETAASARTSVPTMAIAGGTVGDALEQQLRPITDDLSAHAISDCGHLIPLEQPAALAATITPFLA